MEYPERDAQILLEHFCSILPHRLPLVLDTDFVSPELLAAVEKRRLRYPLQYIIGAWSFMTEEYEVNEHCLIPRQDTELLVETAIKLLPKNASFADLCTGSGCVAVSTLAARKDCRATAVDIFPETLATAVRNAEKNRVADRFCAVRADVLTAPVPAITENAPFHAILSNPPYIRQGVIDTLAPEVGFEPRTALDGGPDGLEFYRAIFELYTPLLSHHGFFAFEIGYDQGQALKNIAAAVGFDCRIYSDMGGNDRVAVAKKL